MLLVRTSTGFSLSLKLVCFGGGATVAVAILRGYFLGQG